MGIELEISDDGTIITSRTGKVPDEYHHQAEKFMDELADLCVGEVKVTKLKGHHHHHHHVKKEVKQ